MGGGPNGQIVSVKRGVDVKRQRSRKIVDQTREKYKNQERVLAEHLDGLESNDFCDFDKPRKRAY